jgi:hypothetical protein
MIPFSNVAIELIQSSLRTTTQVDFPTDKTSDTNNNEHIVGAQARAPTK